VLCNVYVLIVIGALRIYIGDHDDDDKTDIAMHDLHSFTWLYARGHRRILFRYFWGGR